MNLPQTKAVQNSKPLSSFLDKNEVHGCGSLLRDVECRSTATGKLVARFVLVVRHKELRQYLSCVAWETAAEKVRSLKRGQRLKIVGWLQNSSWEKDGHKHYKSEINCWQIVIEGAEGAVTSTTGLEVTDADVLF